MERNPNEIVKELDVLDILSNRPCGMTLPEIGNEMGVNWRGLADTVSLLMSEGSIEKLGNRYFSVNPNKKGGDYHGSRKNNGLIQPG